MASAPSKAACRPSASLVMPQILMRKSFKLPSPSGPGRTPSLHASVPNGSESHLYPDMRQLARETCRCASRFPSRSFPPNMTALVSQAFCWSKEKDYGDIETEGAGRLGHVHAAFRRSYPALGTGKTHRGNRSE